MSDIVPRTPEEEEAYDDGFICGRSPNGLFDENPFKHPMSRKRKLWHQGWLNGGVIYLQKSPTPDPSP